jgi:hypothetical protein
MLTECFCLSHDTVTFWFSNLVFSMRKCGLVGKLVMVASTEGKGWHGEIEALCLDLYVLSAVDGSGRCLVAKNGGWPCWADESTVFFHRQADDGWWSVFQITLSEQGTA